MFEALAPDFPAVAIASAAAEAKAAAAAAKKDNKPFWLFENVELQHQYVSYREGGMFLFRKKERAQSYMLITVNPIQVKTREGATPEELREALDFVIDFMKGKRGVLIGNDDGSYTSITMKPKDN